MFNKIICGMVVLVSISFGKVKDRFEPIKDLKLLSGFDSLYVKFVGNWPFGPSFAVSFDAEGNLVSCGSGGGVYILNISNPLNPQKISEIRSRGVVRGLFYDSGNKRLYIAGGQGGLEIWDITNPSNPVKLGYYFTPGYPYGVYVSGSYAYVVDYNAGLQIYKFYLNIEEKEKESVSFIRILKNPVSDEIKLVFENLPCDELKISLYNVLGERIKVYSINKGSKSINLDIKGITNGIYFLKIENKKFKETNKGRSCKIIFNFII